MKKQINTLISILFISFLFSNVFADSIRESTRIIGGDTPDNFPPTAALDIYPTEGTAPLTVMLDASRSIDSDGMIVKYNWIATDGQQLSTDEAVINMTFSNVGVYYITLRVTDNEDLESIGVQQIVTVTANDGTDTVPVASEEPVTPQPTTEPVESNVAHLEFIGLKDFYQVGERLVVELVETANRDKYTRVDLWVAIQLPSEMFLFKTDIPLSPWSPQPQAHKTSIENTESSHYIFDFEVPEGMGGDYTFFAVYVKEDKNPVTDRFVYRSNLVMQQIFLANRKD